MTRYKFVGLSLAIFCLGLISFLIGLQISSAPNASPLIEDSPIKFEPIRSVQPQLTFFSISFCPHNLGLMSTVRSLSQLFGPKIILTPHYLFAKISNLPAYCRQLHGDANRCPDYVKRGFFPSIETCQVNIGTKTSACLNEKTYLRSPAGSFYTSINGRQEVAQNIREICAFRSAGASLNRWWDFVINIRENCTFLNADSCWQDQAAAAGINANQVTECFNKEAFKIIEEEITVAQKYLVSSSPSILLNEIAYSPANRPLVINNDTIYPKDFRTPDTIKKLICASYPSLPEECLTTLPPADYPLSDGSCAIPQ